ncbi:MAG TPA: 3-deoxy-D-manno-octulosonate 8-phosphate phosphatase [Saprospiraceae bacterium]|nr:3-deoxy-D-manno-octulosonate 8-phosphate phosphatase [Saprospiraceae bacterium]
MNLLEPFNYVKTLIFDVDGVFTDSRVTVLEDGSMIRVMNVRDGFAVKEALRAGLRLIVITGGSSQGVVKRLKGLGIKEVYWGIQDKMAIYEEIIAKHGLDESFILYMGDDIPDLSVMRRVGFPVCPADAATEIVEIAQYISPLVGGAGCVRDVIEKTMRVQGTWPVIED